MKNRALCESKCNVGDALAPKPSIPQEKLCCANFVYNIFFSVVTHVTSHMFWAIISIEELHFNSPYERSNGMFKCDAPKKKNVSIFGRFIRCDRCIIYEIIINNLPSG